MTGVDPLDDARELDVLFVPPWRFRVSPQVGVPLHLTWNELARWLSQPTIGAAKDEAGAWSPALYRDGVRRKAALVHAHALVVDVDQGGDVDRVAAVVARNRAIVHSTFSSVPSGPRCRVVLALAEPIDAATYEATHAVVRRHLRAAGVEADEGAKDASRVSYSPVLRAGTEYRFRVLDGAPSTHARCSRRSHPHRRARRLDSTPRSTRTPTCGARSDARPPPSRARARAPDTTRSPVRRSRLPGSAWTRRRLGAPCYPRSSPRRATHDAMRASARSAMPCERGEVQRDRAGQLRAARAERRGRTRRAVRRGRRARGGVRADEARRVDRALD